mmetsp:Transcript_56066/g.109769  ORF Transcript_56066/g.109769 Transcript_56066/m.109769 type:complete len:208 (-) Transcript_56066:711-1334(-)
MSISCRAFSVSFEWCSIAFSSALSTDSGSSSLKVTTSPLSTGKKEEPSDRSSPLTSVLTNLSSAGCSSSSRSFSRVSSVSCVTSLGSYSRTSFSPRIFASSVSLWASASRFAFCLFSPSAFSASSKKLVVLSPAVFCCSAIQSRESEGFPESLSDHGMPYFSSQSSFSGGRSPERRAYFFSTNSSSDFCFISSLVSTYRSSSPPFTL